ncbi:nuclear transport factor 2 family protein [Glaciibacter psychrotolerans]|uniref:3-phenylpropionate/cinnamic acid dioxygenase small subunit n=1 Tax=Glaciibacter psychrotolerans TaxID=670054 RepID=A0A7Z0EF67_9MICO|nr:3-phenylpropionate/cinnamic acid dioxygenase small subunit [Leifsonia psychrotolerans]
MSVGDHRLADAADRSEINDLLARVAQLADSGTPEEYLACFSDEPVWELVAAHGLPLDPQIVRGRESLLESVRDRRTAGVQGPGSHTCHAVQRAAVVVDGDSARADSIFLYYTHTDQTPLLAALGQYADEFVRVSGEWLLAKRTIRRD